MILLFAPALVSLALILAIVLREQFTFRRSVPMLDQIHEELAPRRLVRESQRTSDVKVILTFQASRVLLRIPSRLAVKESFVVTVDEAIAEAEKGNCLPSERISPPHWE